MALCLDGVILGATVWAVQRAARADRPSLPGWGLPGWGLTLSTGAALVLTAGYWATGFAVQAARAPGIPPPPPILTVTNGAAIWEGTIDFDTYDALQNTLAAHPDLTALHLNSPGGRIGAARGMARLVREAGLDTLATGTCASACTLVFIEGRARRLGPKGRLGFHGYRLNSNVPTLDVNDEQARDQARFAQRGVQSDFLDRAFAVPFEDMWFASKQTLLTAGVLTE